jgi:acyl carrier protein
MGLQGRLKDWLSNSPDLRSEDIPRLEPDEMNAFFQGRTGSENWKMFYGDGASGIRHYVLVEFQPERPPAPEPVRVPLTPSAVEWRVRKILVEQLGVDDSQFDLLTTLVDGLGVDDIDMVEIANDLEEEFELPIPNSDVKRWKTVGNVVTYIARRTVDPSIADPSGEK